MKNENAIANSVEVRALFEECSGSWMCGEDAVEIQPGDWYWAQRNGPPRILRCKANNQEHGWISATTSAYLYNTAECFRIKAGIPFLEVARLAEKHEEDFRVWSRSQR